MEILNFSPLFEENGRTAISFDEIILLNALLSVQNRHMIFARRANPEKQKSCIKI